MKRLLRKYFLSFSSLIIIPLKGFNKIVSQFVGFLQIKIPAIKRGSLLTIQRINAQLKNIIIPKYKGIIKALPLIQGNLAHIIEHSAGINLIKLKTKIVSQLIRVKSNRLKSNINTISKFYIKLIIHRLVKINTNLKTNTNLIARFFENGVSSKAQKTFTNTKLKLKSIVGTAKISKLFISTKSNTYAKFFSQQLNKIYLNLNVKNSLNLNLIEGNAKVSNLISSVTTFAIGNLLLGIPKKITGFLNQKTTFFGSLKNTATLLPRNLLIIKNKIRGSLSKILATSIRGFNTISTLFTGIMANNPDINKHQGFNTTSTLMQINPHIDNAKTKVGKEKTATKISGALSVNIVYSWESPEQTGNNLLITQVFSGTQDGSVLEIN